MYKYNLGLSFEETVEKYADNVITAPVKEIMRDYETEISQAKEEIEIAKQKEEDVIPILEIFSESAAKHTAILGNIATKSPELEEEIQPALNVSEEGRTAAVTELANITGKAYGQ